MPLDQIFWQEELSRIMALIVAIWTDASWASAIAVMQVMTEAGIEPIDEAEVYAAIMDWIYMNAPGQAVLIMETTRKLVEEALALWDGEDEEALAALLEPIFGANRANAIGITEAVLAFAMGNLIAWNKYGIIEEVIWMTAEDERVCAVCGPLHEVVIGLVDALYGGQRPPAHTLCRCWLEAIVVLQKVSSLADALFAGLITRERLEEVAYVI